MIDSMTAAGLRHAAVRRLGDVAGYDERLDIGLTLARPRAVEILYRQALRKARGDELLVEEVEKLVNVARGRPAALDDALHELNGLPERTPTQSMSLDEFEQTVTEVFS